MANRGKEEMLNPNHYFGRLCKHHPELEGERLRCSYKCVRCQAEQWHRWNKGIERPFIRIPTSEYKALLARVAELETRLYGAPQEAES